MHKLESLALTCGSKIHKPYIHKSYYPIFRDNFICVSQQSDCEAKSYDYLDDVIFHIKPYLDEQGISILEVGESGKDPLFHTNQYMHLNYSQTNYILSKSKLYFGNLNLSAHTSSALNIPIVCPSQHTFIDLEKPYWSKDNCCIINPESELKPTFSDKEYPKTINSVGPEVIACNILDQLGIKHHVNNINTVFLGPEYNNRVIDIVPGNYPTSNLSVAGVLNVRMDKNFDLAFLDSCSNLNLFNIITDKKIPIANLKRLSDKLKGITYFIDSKTNLDSIKEMESLGKPMNLLSRDSKNISKIRLKFIDYSIRELGSLNKDSLNNGNLKDLKFLSKRNIIFEGKAYNSYSSISRGANSQEVVNSKEFFDDLPFCRVYKETT